MSRIGFSNKQQVQKKEAYFNKVLKEGKDKAKIDEQISSLEKKMDLYKRGIIAENMMPKIPSIQKLKELIHRSNEILVSGEIKGTKLTSDQISSLKEKISDWEKQLSDKTRKHKKLYSEYLKKPEGQDFKKGGKVWNDKELLKKISPTFDIIDGYIIIESYDRENNILIINDKSKNNNTILYGKIVDFSNMNLGVILEKLSYIEECKLKKEKYTLS